ncbi:MAG TPA: hypothetical protein GXX29_13260, partial [Firmicutes bacterium]|nr:hypothetical protein [Bacillota bacterium]
MKLVKGLFYIALLVTIILNASGTTAYAYRAQSVSPESFLSSSLNNPNLKQAPGESWAWNAAYNIEHFMYAYRAWGDTGWLDAAVKYYDYLVSQLQKGPDGYLGWIGPYIYDTTQWCDAHVSDALLFNGMLHFAEIVLQYPELEKVYGEKARHYVQLAEVHLIEKWDARGTWYEYGPFGTYFSWNYYLNPEDFSRWHKRDNIKNSNLSLPANKNTRMAIAALRLFRITGKEEYRDKAVKIFALLKSRMQLYNDFYVWNYWEPTVPWDINVKANTMRHWVGVHPTASYQTNETWDIAEAYLSGIVFTEEDIQRIINTNLKVMWNQDRTAPAYRSSSAGIQSTSDAGALWPALAYFDQTARDLINFGGTSSRDRIFHAYLENVVFAEPPSFKRTLLRDGIIKELDFPQSSVRNINMALVLPSVAKPGEVMILAANTLQSGRLRVELYDAAGANALLTLLNRQVGKGLVTFTWNGRDGQGNQLPPGDYRVRW